VAEEFQASGSGEAIAGLKKALTLTGNEWANPKGRSRAMSMRYLVRKASRERCSTNSSKSPTTHASKTCCGASDSRRKFASVKWFQCKTELG